MDDQEREWSPKDRPVLGRTGLEMGPCMVALRKAAIPPSGLTECVEKGSWTPSSRDLNASSTNVNPAETKEMINQIILEQHCATSRAVAS